LRLDFEKGPIHPSPLGPSILTGGGRETQWGGGAFRRGRGDGRNSVRGEKLRGSSRAFTGVGGTGGVAGLTVVVNDD
jgi:hypothetical protein